jgi:hypothetical protein
VRNENENENEKQQHTNPTCQCETVGGKDLFPSIPKKEKNAITMGFKKARNGEGTNSEFDVW